MRERCPLRQICNALCPLKKQKEGFVTRDAHAPLRNRWSTKGVLYLSNFRMVFVANKEDDSGVASCL